jgi:two-component system sensor histidine kinase/response regulator
MNTPSKMSRVLIVDDEASNIAILDRLFRNEYTTKTATNGQLAIDMLQQEPFDLVLLDIMMPLISGLEVLKFIRQNPGTSDIPVILISARMDENDIVEGFTIGANDYVTKPFRLAELRARARTQLTLKHLQDERKQTIDELRTAHDLKDRFLRIASHDLKGPLGNLRLVQYLMRKRIKDEDEKSVELLSSADSNINLMQGVINEFLDMAALQSGKIELRVANVEIEPMIKQLLNQYQVSAVKKDITVETNVSGTICADTQRLEQALGNLISNALKYSPREKTVKIWTEPRNERIRICVADQGPGIPEDEKDKLFTQFGKLTPRPTDGESSTGLGLWIAKHLTTLQGGDIGVDTPAAGGSVFWIELPVARPQEAGEAAPTDGVKHGSD